jgi:hypothetical protein
MALVGSAGLKKSRALCQEATRDELLKSLKITLEEALEFNIHESIAAARGNYREERIAV